MIVVELTKRNILDRRFGLLGWALGLIAYSIMIVSLYPTIRDSSSLVEAIEDYPDVLKDLLGGESGFDLTTAAGFVNTEFFTFVLPLMLLTVAVGVASSLGSDQQTGLIDIVLCNSVSRREVVVAKSLTIVASVLSLAMVTVCAIQISGLFVDLGLSLSHLVAATIAVATMVIFHGLAALAASAFFGSRSASVGTAVLLFASGYLLSALSSLVDWLEPVRVLSPYYHALGPNPLVNGWHFTEMAILLGLCIVTGVVATELFEHRDLA